MTGTRSSAHPVPLPRPPHAYGAQAAALVEAVDRDPWGSVRPSVYETARVLSLAPWLPGHELRLAWVLEQQAPDGSWGKAPHPTGCCRRSAPSKPFFPCCAMTPRPGRNARGTRPQQPRQEDSAL